VCGGGAVDLEGAWVAAGTKQAGMSKCSACCYPPGRAVTTWRDRARAISSSTPAIMHGSWHGFATQPAPAKGTGSPTHMRGTSTQRDLFLDRTIGIFYPHPDPPR